MRFSEVPLVSGAIPLFGHARAIQADRAKFLLSASREQPDAGRVRTFGREIFFTTSPAVVHEVFVEKARLFEKTPQTRLLLHLLAGEGLFTAEAEPWRRHRRLMAPIFQPAAIPRYVRVITDVVARAAKHWKPGATIDVGREMTRIAMAVVGKALFDADAFDEADALGDALTIALDWTNEQVASPRLALQLAIRDAVENAEGRVPEWLERRRAALLHALRTPVLLSRAHSPRLRGAIARLDARIQAMIEERRAARNPPDDLLTRLLRARDEDGLRMDDRQVRDEAVTLFVAGHETTATALTWALYMIARDSRVRSRLLAEADSIRSNGDLQDPSRIKYAIKVFKETMRLYPPVYMLSRRACEPVTVAGYELDRSRDCPHEPLRAPSASGVLPRPGALRSRALRARGRGPTPAIGVRAVRRGPARLRREPLRAHGGARHPPGPGPASVTRGLARAHRTGGVCDVAPALAGHGRRASARAPASGGGIGRPTPSG